MLEIVPLVLGPVATNAYLLAEAGSGEAVVIDPAWEGRLIATSARTAGWEIRQFWYSHAHFDHFGGAAELARLLPQRPQVALHSADRLWWKMRGGGSLYGIQVRPGPAPTIDLEQVHELAIGSLRFEVRHTPGHTPGSCSFYCPQEAVAFTGDLIFAGSVGRTDLPGGDRRLLLRSIREQILSLPDGTRLHPGHGPATSVGAERARNPFLREE